MSENTEFKKRASSISKSMNYKKYNSKTDIHTITQWKFSGCNWNIYEAYQKYQFLNQCSYTQP